MKIKWIYIVSIELSARPISLVILRNTCSAMIEKATNLEKPKHLSRIWKAQRIFGHVTEFCQNSVQWFFSEFFVQRLKEKSANNLI
jgi:hypothetical protein